MSNVWWLTTHSKPYVWPQLPSEPFKGSRSHPQVLLGVATATPSVNWGWRKGLLWVVDLRRSTFFFNYLFISLKEN